MCLARAHGAVCLQGFLVSKAHTAHSILFSGTTAGGSVALVNKTDRYFSNFLSVYLVGWTGKNRCFSLRT